MDDRHPRRGLRRRWNDFFFAEEVPYGLALMRICLPLALLIPFAQRWSRARELMSADGAPAPLWDSFGYPGLLPIPSGSTAVALMTLLGCSLVTLVIGWRTRTSAAIAAALTVYLGMLDMLSTLTKYTCIAAHALLLLSLSPAGSLWSVDAWLARRDRTWTGRPQRTRYPIWPQRLVQCLFAIIYFASAFTKTQTPLYFSGDQLYFWLLTNVNYSNPVGEWLSLYPPVILMMGLVTVTWEFVFPFLCWRGISKAGVLALGAVFHAMTALTLGLIVFPLVCLACYWAFLTESELQAAATWCRRQLRRRPAWRAALRSLSIRLPAPPAWATPRNAAGAFAAGCAVLIALGLEVEHRLDRYRARTGEPPQPLPVIEPALAREMLAGTERIRLTDKMFGFDVGTQTVGGLLADARVEFQHGQKAIVQCIIVPPHEDLWLEINLHDARNRIIERCGQVMTREKVRSHVVFDVTEKYPVGNYDLVLQIEGKEVDRRRIVVHPRATVAASGGPPPATQTAWAQ